MNDASDLPSDTAFTLFLTGFDPTSFQGFEARIYLNKRIEGY